MVMVEPPARPKPLESLVASAKRVSNRKVADRASGSVVAEPWQADAWDMFDKIGEFAYLTTTLASRLAQARLYVGELTDDLTDTPTPTTNTVASDLLNLIGATAVGRAPIIERLGLNLFVAGEGWIVGVPTVRVNAPADEDGDDEPVEARIAKATTGPGADPAPDARAEEWRHLDHFSWFALSVDEVTAVEGGERVQVRLDHDKVVTLPPDDLILVRCWRPHPRYAWRPVSAAKSSLPILREITETTERISASNQSRLAGNGILWLAESAQRMIQASAAASDGTPATEDVLTDALIETMMTPIRDRESASAVVPVIATVPDETVDKMHHMRLSDGLEVVAKDMRENAIRRLALSQDAPPELLLGTGGMNHWGAWLVQEDVVTTHLEPPLALICDALTTQFLWPALAAQGIGEEERQRHVVWYDVSDLVVKPNRAGSSVDLFDRGLLSGSAVREANGFDEADAPAEDADPLSGLPPEVTIALQAVREAPSLAAVPGLPVLVEQVRQVLAGGGGGVPAAPTTTTTAPVTAPVTEPGTVQDTAPGAGGGPGSGTPGGQAPDTISVPAGVGA